MNKLLIALAGTLLVAGCSTTAEAPAAAAAPPAPPASPAPLSISSTVEASATVTRLDVATRSMTLRTDAGEEHTLEVSEAVRNLPQVKVGDRVTVTWYEAIGAQMRKPGDSTEPTIDLGAGRADPGERPGGIVATVQTIPVTIVSVDPATNTVKFYAADKQVRTIAVKRPEAQAYIRTLKTNDEVIITFAEALAIEVKPAQ